MDGENEVVVENKVTTPDRGDIYVPPTQQTPPAQVEEKKDPVVEEEKKVDQPRDNEGKFTKKEKDDEEVRIPKSRFDEQVAKERERAEAAERRLAALEAKIGSMEKEKETPPPSVDEVVSKMESDIEKLHEERDNALVDGDVKKAGELLKTIRRAEREMARFEAENVATRVTDTRSEEARIDTVVSELEATYDVLRRGSDSFDPRMVNYVLAEQTRLINEERLSPSQALARAGKETMELFGHKAKGQEKGEEKGEEKDTKGEEEQQRRSQEARAKALDAATKQPGNMKDVGLDSDKAGAKTAEIEPSKLSYDEFKSLTEEQRRKLRGDFI